MNKYCAAMLALVLSLGAVGVALAANITTPPSTQANPDPAALSLELVQRAFNDVRGNHPEAAATELDKAIASSGFAQLPRDTRYGALMVATLLAAQSGHSRKAHELALQTTAFDQADDTAWMVRLSTAYSTGDTRDAAHSVGMLAQRWPARLTDLASGLVRQLHQQLLQADAADADRKMLDALFDANWSPQDGDPGDLWRDLALALLQHREVARATAVALRVASAQTAIGMLVDKRFDPIVSAHREAFDVDKLIAAQIAKARARVRAHPDQLAPVTELQELYLLTRAYPQVLAISDAAVAHAEHGDGAKAYTDFADRYNWILDNRSRALARSGHWQDAVNTETLAARRPEQGAMNVSQLINLAELHAKTGQPDKAVATIVELGNMSPFGRMQLENVKLMIAVAKRNHAAIATAMDYLRTHRTDAIATWQDALLLRGQFDAAAALLIERLRNPEWRNAALIDMQHYASGDEAPLEKTMRENLDTVIARADVQAELNKVGRVERFSIAAHLR